MIEKYRLILLALGINLDKNIRLDVQSGLADWINIRLAVRNGLADLALSKFIRIAILLIIISFNGFAQNKILVDSLLTKLELTKNDSVKANIYKELCWEYRNDSLKLAYEYGIKALNLFTQQKNILGQCNVLNKLGIVKRNTGEYSLALDYFFKILTIAQQPMCNTEIAYANNNICDINIRLEKYDKALEFAEKAYSLFQLVNDKSGIAYNLNQKGLIYKNQKKWNQALNNFKQSLELRLKIGRQASIAASWQYIGDCYIELNFYDSALVSYKNSLQLYDKIGERSSFSACYLGFGKYYAAAKNYKASISYLNQSIEIAKKFNQPSTLQNAYSYLHKIYAETNDFKNAYKSHIQWSETKDSLQKTDYVMKITQLEMNYTFEQQNKLKEIEDIKKKTLYESKIVEQRLMTIGLSVILLIIVVLAFFIFRNYKYVRKTNTILLQNITDLRNAEQQINKLSIAIEQSPTTVVITDIHGNIEYINPNFTKLTGYTAQEVIGNNPRLLKSGKTNPKIYEDLWATISKGETWKGEFVNKNKNGVEFIENAVIAPVFDKNQKIINFIAIEEDITARKQAEETLFNERSLFRTIIDLIPDAIYVKDIEGSKILANPKEVQLSGKNYEADLIGKTDFDIFPESVATHSAEEDKSIINSGKPILNIESYLIDKNGNVRWQLGAKVPLQDIHRQIIGIVGLSHDITERKQAEAALQQSNEELKALNENIEQQKNIIEISHNMMQEQAMELSEKNMELEKFNFQLKKYHTVLEQSPTAVVITDVHGNIEYVNPFFTKITGYTLEEALGKNPRILKTNKTPKQTFIDLWQTILSGKVWVGILTNHKKDKSIFVERAIIAPIFDNDKIINFVAIKEDVTELKKAEQLILESLETTRKQKVIIEKSYKDITDSINYAKTIQEALLTRKDLINAYFEEFFLFFKPKQVVSGDFYYVNKIDDQLIFAVADCTGHGVPGGFITILGITYLHETVRQKEIKSASEVLNNLRQRIKATFRTFGTDNTNGMDIVYCSVNTKTNMLQYAGANNPLFIVRNDELLEYSATRNPIGFFQKEKDFENNEIQLYDNDIIYLFSDGFQDQFGGQDNRKFTKKRLKELVFEIHQKPLAVQQEIIENTLQNWQKNLEQVDDISMLAVKWKIS